VIVVADARALQQRHMFVQLQDTSAGMQAQSVIVVWTFALIWAVLLLVQVPKRSWMHCKAAAWAAQALLLQP
jgi:hypothetical protein